MTEPPRATMDRHHNGIRRQSIGVRRCLVIDLTDCLNFNIMIARAKRSHFPTLSFFCLVGNTIWSGVSRQALVLDLTKITLFTPAALYGPRSTAAQHRLHLRIIEGY